MNDRLALVTGSSSGIGAAVARRLLERGWTVIGMARRHVALSGGPYRHVTVDLADIAASCESIGRAVTPMLESERWSRIGLVNNAASGGLLGPIERIRPADLQRLLAVNVTAPVWLTGLLLRHGPTSAARRIVNVSSGAAVRAFPGLAAYGGSKAALRMAGMVAAEELGSADRPPPALDVAILSYEPGTVDTDMQREARSLSPDEFPWVGLFRLFSERGMLVPADAPAGEIVEFLEADAKPRFSERRLQPNPARFDQGA
jgi:NAD(P)-dependent dehydrogenase (short-subunit alcohol dehydrogenase family)